MLWNSLNYWFDCCYAVGMGFMFRCKTLLKHMDFVRRNYDSYKELRFPLNIPVLNGFTFLSSQTILDFKNCTFHSVPLSTVIIILPLLWPKWNSKRSKQKKQQHADVVLHRVASNVMLATCKLFYNIYDFIANITFINVTMHPCIQHCTGSMRYVYACAWV